MPQFFCNAKSDLSGAIASATMALPGNIIYGLIAFAPLGSEYAGQGILAGLYASVFAGFFAAVFGGAEGTISGPRAPTALVFGSFMGQLLASEAFTGDPASVVALGFFVLFLSGVFQVVFGVFRLGGVVKFISYPVIAGIMNGTVIVLLIGAVGEFLGIPKDYSNLSQLPGQVKPFTILVAAVSMLLWLYGNSWPSSWTTWGYDPFLSA